MNFGMIFVKQIPKKWIKKMTVTWKSKENFEIHGNLLAIKKKFIKWAEKLTKIWKSQEKLPKIWDQCCKNFLKNGQKIFLND